MEKQDYIALEEFRKALAEIAADREVFKNMIEAHEKEDVKMFQEIMKKLELDRPICIWVCRFICWIQHIIRCERVCTILCRW